MQVSAPVTNFSRTCAVSFSLAFIKIFDDLEGWLLSVVRQLADLPGCDGATIVQFEGVSTLDVVHFLLLSAHLGEVAFLLTATNL